MSRNTTLLVLLTTLALAMTVAGIAGRSAAPAEWMTDQRRSTLLYGPGGASAVAEVLARFGVDVDQWRRPLFRFGFDGSAATQGRWLAFLSIPQALTESERERVLRHLEQGGGVFIAGATGLEGCFGLRVERVPEDGDRPTIALLDARLDVDPPRRVFARVEDEDVESLADVMGGRDSARCAVPVTSSAPLLRATNGAVVVWRVSVVGGGTAILLADDAYLTNQALRDTDAGALVIPFLIDERPTQVTFDEYHQGFQEGGSIFGAVTSWVVRSPVGWVLLQLGLAGVVLLLVVMIRFGPALRVVGRRRRSPLEHLSALAVGLERAKGHQTAVQLLVNGLRRRLRRSGAVYRDSTKDVGQWLRTLELATRRKGTKPAIAALRSRVAASATDDDVLQTAQAVEDVWNALRTTSKPKRF